jgi:hypothetical protein
MKIGEELQWEHPRDAFRALPEWSALRAHRDLGASSSWWVIHSEPILLNGDDLS